MTTEDDLYTWLDEWWSPVGQFLLDPEDSVFGTLRERESLTYRAATLSDDVHGIDIRPLKKLLRSVVAYSEPGPINGPKPTIDKLHKFSSDAWETYQRFARTCGHS